MAAIKIDTALPHLSFNFDASEEIGLQVVYEAENGSTTTYEFGDTTEEGTQVWFRKDKWGMHFIRGRAKLDQENIIKQITRCVLGRLGRYETLSSTIDGERMQGLPDDAAGRAYNLIFNNQKLIKDRR